MEEDTKESKTRYPHASPSNKGTVIVGLKILVQISQRKSSVVVKPALGSTRSASRRRSAASDDQYYCFLKSCYLCNKNLSLDKEVYMYRYKVLRLSLSLSFSSVLRVPYVYSSNKIMTRQWLSICRGDQGFCSIECRERQIFLDEMKELEASRKNFLKSNNRHCNIGADHHRRRETRVVLQELRRETQHNKPPCSQRNIYIGL